jgi:hypothetical protein
LPDWLAFEPTWGDEASELPPLAPEDWAGGTAMPVASPPPLPLQGIPNLTSIDALLAELPTLSTHPPVAPAVDVTPPTPSPANTPPSTEAPPQAEAEEVSPEPPALWVNKRVQHDTYGEGTVLKAMPLNGRLIITVEFDHVGKRMLDPELSPMQLM